jgi:hypothetical protein
MEFNILRMDTEKIGMLVKGRLQDDSVNEDMLNEKEKTLPKHLSVNSTIPKEQLPFADWKIHIANQLEEIRNRKDTEYIGAITNETKLYNSIKRELTKEQKEKLKELSFK